MRFWTICIVLLLASSAWAADKALEREARRLALKKQPVYPQVGVVAVPVGKGWVLGVSPLINTPLGACGSLQECTETTDEMCEDAGHGGVDEATVEITTADSGDKTCSGDCEQNGAVAMVLCKNTTIMDEPDPAGTRWGVSDVAPAE